MPVTLTAADWEAHRATIHQLYIERDMSRKDLMAHMKDTYGFVASRSQYESKLKQWKMIKNLTQKEWQLVIGHLNERRRQGKENSVVSLHDRRIPNAKLRKAVQRYSIPTLHDRFFGPSIPLGAAAHPSMPLGITIRTPSPVPLQDNPFLRIFGQEALGAAGQISMTRAQRTACHKWVAGMAVDMAPDTARNILKSMLGCRELLPDYVFAQGVFGNSETLSIEEFVSAFEKHISSREEQFGADDARTIHAKVTLAGILLEVVLASLRIGLEDDLFPWQSDLVQQLSNRAWEALRQVLGIFFRESWVERLLPSRFSRTLVPYRDALWDDDGWVKTMVESYAKSPDLFQAAAWSMWLYFKTSEAILYVAVMRGLKAAVRIGLFLEVDGATAEDLKKQGCSLCYQVQGEKVIKGFVVTGEYYRIYGINPQLLQKGEGEEEVGTSGSGIGEAHSCMVFDIGVAQKWKETEQQEVNKAYEQLQAFMDGMRL